MTNKSDSADKAILMAAFAKMDPVALAVALGTIWALILVVILQGKTTGVNILKGVFVQVGPDMEEAARASGAGRIRT